MTDLINGFKNPMAEVIEDGDAKDGDDAVRAMMEDAYFKKIVGKKSITTKNSLIPTKKEADKKAGQVVSVGNIYSEIMPYNDFLKLSIPERKKVLFALNEKFLAKDIAKKWGVKQSAVYRIKKELAKATGTTTPRKYIRKTSKVVESNFKTQKSEQKSNQKEVKVKNDYSCKIEFTKVFTGEMAQDYTLKFIDMIEPDCFVDAKLIIKQLSSAIGIFYFEIEEKEYTFEELKVALLKNISSLPKESVFVYSLSIKEIKHRKAESKGTNDDRNNQ